MVKEALKSDCDWLVENPDLISVAAVILTKEMSRLLLKNGNLKTGCGGETSVGYTASIFFKSPKQV